MAAFLRATSITETSLLQVVINIDHIVAIHPATEEDRNEYEGVEAIILTSTKLSGAIPVQNSYSDLMEKMVRCDVRGI